MNKLEKALKYAILFEYMQEKKNQEKSKPLLELEKEVTEILVANGRSFQPFIRTFSYTGENISKVNLGTLVGVFEVDEKSEDSEYIVNFLASVAKKEYFNNPRRGAIESFEGALHKVNLALAELVKHGNVAWLGKFHGALGVLEKNHLHFSVTGDARILLYRNGNLADISEGLASEESKTHPIKTFVEVSSGRLMIEDQIILSSPEIFSLFSLEEIEKNAIRMDRERFSQFLKTALRNELDMSGTLIIDIKKAIPREKEVQKNKPEILPNIHNVFSQSAFDSNTKKDSPVSDETTPSLPDKENIDYIDTKTGHIYVQGETPEDKPDSPLLDTLLTSVKDTSHSLRIFFSSQSKWLRKAKKQSLIAFDSLREQIKITGRQTYRLIRKQWKKKILETKKKEIESAESLHTEALSKGKESSLVPVTDIPKKKLDYPQQIREESEELPVAEPISDQHSEEIPLFLKEKLEKFYREDKLRESQKKISKETNVSHLLERILPSITQFLGTAKNTLRNMFKFDHRVFRLVIESIFILWKNIVSFYKKLEPLQKKIILGGIIGLFLVTFLGAYLYKNISLPENISEEEKEQVPAAPGTQNQNNGNTIDAPTTIASSIGTMASLVILDNETYIVTTNSIFHPRTGRSYSIPSNNNARFASAMDDLRLLFVLTENNTLYAWSPINQSFTENSISLPENAHIENIGTYLTYLYVLESSTDQIYRFPRAESGFGQGVSWLKETLSIETTSKMAVNETIFISSTPNSLQAYFRGRLTRPLTLPESTSITSLYTHPGLQNVYALDKDKKKILVWNQDGAMVAQYSQEKFGEGKSFSVNEQTNELFLITDNNALLSFKLR